MPNTAFLKGQLPTNAGSPMFDLGRQNGTYSDRASGYRFIGIHCRPDPSEYGVASYLFVMGGAEAAQNSTTKEPFGIIFDRCAISGGTTKVRSGALLLCCRNSAVRNCYIYHIWTTNTNVADGFGWADTCGIIANNNSGGILIENNYIDATGEPIMFGGGAQNIQVDQTDCVVRKNRIYKDRAFYAAQVTNEDNITTKNLLEFKQVLRLVVEDNHFENSYDTSGGGQAGGALVTKLQSYGSPNHDPQSGHMLFRGNRVKDFAIGIGPNGFDNSADSSMVGYLQELHFYDNLFEGWYNLGNGFTSPRFMVFSTECAPIYFEHNTLYAANSVFNGMVILFDSLMQPVSGIGLDALYVRKNILHWGEWSNNGGIHKGGTTPGTTALNGGAVTWDVTDNAFMRGITGTPSGYPSGNSYHAAWTELYESADLATGDYSPKTGWAERLATDGWPKGISDWSHWKSRLSGV